jgi:uncharacterized membrane protein YccC
MISLSMRAKEAIKTALAMVIAIGIALAMNWPKPYWAGFAVAMISLSTTGQSLNKGTMRMLGTLVGAVMALLFVAMFAQDRWWFMASISAYYGFCTYMLTGKKQQYFWYVSAFVSLIICTSASADLEHAFQVAVERTKETGMGILVYTLVSIFLWPNSSESELNNVSRKLFATQNRLFQLYRGLITGKRVEGDQQTLRRQEVQLLGQFGQILNAAESDSYEVFEIRQQWRHFHHQLIALMESLERWRVSLPEIQQLDFPRHIPNLHTYGSEIEVRFDQIERMLAGENPERFPQTVTLPIEAVELQALSHFQRAAAEVAKNELDGLDGLSRSLFDCIRNIRGLVQHTVLPSREETLFRRLAIDPDRCLAVFQVLVTILVAFLLWVYLDPPGHATFWSQAPLYCMIAVMSQIRPTLLFMPFVWGSLFTGVLYVFVMPHLSGYTQLGVMIFGTIFLIYYVFSEARQALSKMGWLIPFLVLTSFHNNQTYSFSAFANNVAMILLAIALAIATSYIPMSPRPEKAFLRLLTRFFRYCEFLLSSLSLKREKDQGVAGFWKTIYFQSNQLELPEKLVRTSQQVDYETVPDTTPEQVQALVLSLQDLAYRVKALLDVREFPQSGVLMRQVQEDLRAWHLTIESLFRHWGKTPGAQPEGNLRNRLTARIANMETRLDETFTLAQPGEISDEDYRNFYRYLGALRGLSEAVVAYAPCAERVNWAQWQEPRF